MPPPSQDPPQHHDNWGPPPSRFMGAPHPHGGGRPRPLMDIPTYEQETPEPSSQLPADDGKKLQEELKDVEQQIFALNEQINQSEKNLAAQKLVIDDQVKDIAATTIRKSRHEHLELLAHDTEMSLHEIDSVLQPIIDSCTKETIGSGKVWIFQTATNHDRNRLLAHYLAYKVTEPKAPFQLKLHLIYLMNDVVHHCVRKNNDDLKGSLESVIVEMFCSAWLSCADEKGDQGQRENKLTKLINLWQDKYIFSTVSLRRMREVDMTWKSVQDQLALDYDLAIKNASRHLMDTYQNYCEQNNVFLNHAETTIENLEAKKKQLEEEIESKKSAPPVAAPPPAVKGPSTRGSRWDTGSDGQVMLGHAQQLAQDNLVLPDLSRPPPGFGDPVAMRPPVVQENNLIPTLPYYDLPAGLMVPLIKMDDSGYKSLNPKHLRLPPPTPPTERLMAAIEQFYAPPSHDRPRDPEGWEMLGLYEWSRAKTSAIKQKADDIEDNRRERSPTESPDPYASDNGDNDGDEYGSRSPVVEKRYRSRSRSRSRTRSRSSRGSTPDEPRGRSRRSPSPEGDYALPSYLTKRSPSPTSSRRSPVRRSPPRRSPPRRSPSPPRPSSSSSGRYPGGKQLDSSNKGHQMLKRMGWTGTGGLGSTEEGIVEPISGGQVRDRTDQFRGVGHGADPFEAFRKSKAGSFYTRMKERDKERDHGRKSSGGGSGRESFKN